MDPIGCKMDDVSVVVVRLDVCITEICMRRIFMRKIGNHSKRPSKCIFLCDEVIPSNANVVTEYKLSCNVSQTYKPTNWK